MRFHSLLRASITAAAAAGILVATAAAPALSQNDSPCPAGQPPGRQPGQPAPEPQQERGQYPIGECQLRLSQSIAAQGATIQAAGSGYGPGSPVSLALGGRGIGETTAGPDGSFRTDVQIPPDATVGRGVITAEGVDAGGGVRVLSADFTVEASRADAPAAARAGIGGFLPRTGAAIAALSATGAGLIAIGTTAVLAARRRRSTAT